MARSILLVDDDPAIRMSLRQLLTDEGYAVHTARDGRHALQLLDKIDPPDVILLDYRMPVMNAKQFLAVMRQNANWQAIPVVLLSAWTREWSGARAEVADVLMKPVDLDLLLSTVRGIVGDGAKHRA